MAEHDVLRNGNGDAVVLTPVQMRAVWHAISVVESVRRENSYPSMWVNPTADLAKSRLLGRMLIDGRPPLALVPPSYSGGVGYHFAEPDLPHYYLGMTPRLGRIIDGEFVADPIPMTPEEAM